LKINKKNIVLLLKKNCIFAGENCIFAGEFMELSGMGTFVPYFYTKNVMDFKQKVKQLIDRALAERKDLFLIDYNISDTNDIRLTVDGDQGASIDDVVYLSRQIEHNLDREKEDFSIHVSSFDITKAFHLKRQFVKNLNRELKVKTDEGEKKGKLITVDDDKIILEYKVREPKKTGKGKVTVIKQDEIPFEQIKEAKVVLKF